MQVFEFRRQRRQRSLSFAGALLAGTGMKVLLAEKGRRVGGYCQTYDWEGYPMNTGPTLLLGSEEGGILNALLRRLGLGKEVAFRRMEWGLANGKIALRLGQGAEGLGDDVGPGEGEPGQVPFRGGGRLAGDDGDVEKAIDKNLKVMGLIFALMDALPVKSSEENAEENAGKRGGLAAKAWSSSVAGRSTSSSSMKLRAANCARRFEVPMLSGSASYSKPEDVDARLERIERLQGADPGIFVLAVHAFVEGWIRDHFDYQMAGMSFSVSDATRKEVEDQLLKQAVQAFQARAQLASEALGGKQFKLVSLNLNSNGFQQPMPMRMGAMKSSMMSDSAPAQTIEAGTSQVQMNADGVIEVLLP